MSRTRFALLALLYALFMLYASTVVSPTGFSPNGLTFEQALAIFRQVHFIENGSDQRADWMANLVAMIPLGFLVAGAMQQRFAGTPERVGVALGATMLSEAYVLAVKFAQVFFPRTVTLNYITAQSIGAVCGVLLCVLARDHIEVALRRLNAPGTAALSLLLGVYSLALGIFMLVPFDVVLSADDLSLRLSTLGAHLFEIPGEGRSLPIRLVLTAMAVIAVIPVGMWLALGRRAAAAAGLGIMAVVMVTLASMFVLSASPNLLNLPLRVIGVLAGVALVGVLRQHDVEQFRPVLATLGLWLVLPYLIALVVVNGLATTHWRSLDAAMAAVDPRFYIPLWTDYIVTKAQAARSFVAQIAMYAPVGLLVWLRGGRGRAGAWLAGGLAATLSAAVELARWLKPGFLLDINNPAIAAFAAAMTVLLMPVLWRALRSVGRDLPMDAPTNVRSPIARPREPRGGVFGVLLLLTAVVLDGAALWFYPLPAWPLAVGLIVYAMMLWRWPQAWLLVIPVVLPALDLTPWTGWMLVGESDLFVLATLGVLALRVKPSWTDVRLPRGTMLIVALWLGAVAIGLVRGLMLPGPAAGSSDIYMLPLNALRLSKPVGEALLLLVFAAERQRRHADALKLFAWGITLGVCVVAVLAGWERLAFVGLLDFSSDYRIVGPFSSMHIGGGHIGAYLAMAMPFALVGALRWRWWTIFVLPAIALVAVATLIVTYARAAYVATLLSLSATALGLMPSGRRSTFGLLGMALLIVPVGLGLGWAATQSGLMAGRFQTISQDLATRQENWAYGARLQSNTLLARLFGMGIGTYPRLSLAATGPLSGPGDFALGQENGRAFLTLRGRDPLYLGQKVSAVPGQIYRLTFTVRSAGGGRISVALCEKLLLYSMRCGGSGVALAPQTDWTPQHLLIGLDPGPSAWPSRPVDLSLFGSAGSIIDVEDVHLTDPTGVELLTNGQFERGLDRWFFTADDHLSWRIKDQYLMTLFDTGLVGFFTLGALLLGCIMSILRALRNGEALAAAVLGSLVAICASSLFDAVLEAPRLATLIALVAGMALISGNQRKAGVTSTR